MVNVDKRLLIPLKISNRRTQSCFKISNPKTEEANGDLTGIKSQPELPEMHQKVLQVNRRHPQKQMKLQ